MAHAKITLIGFYNYMNSIGDDLFKNLSTPAGIDKSLLVNNILMMGGEYEVLWGDPFFYQNAIGVWSAKWQRTMERWINALSIDYNPLENYDRMEDWIDNSSKSASGSVNGSDEIFRNEAVNKNEVALASDSSESTGNGTTTNTRSAYNAADYQPHDKSESDTSGSNFSSGVTNAVGDTNTAELVQNKKNQSLDNEEIASGMHSGRLHGNIGVTTSQQMLEAELDVSKWNLYNEITELFISEMLIYVDD